MFEFAQHPVNGQLVAATHGRSLWVLDVSALRQIQPQYLAGVPELYEPAPAVRWHSEPSRGGTNRKFVGQNPMFGAEVYYSLPTEAKKASIKIVDVSGRDASRISCSYGARAASYRLGSCELAGAGGRGQGANAGAGGRRSRGGARRCPAGRV